MFIKGQRNRIHVAIIVLLSLISILFFQNCGGGIESQASVSSTSNGGLSTGGGGTGTGGGGNTGGGGTGGTGGTGSNKIAYPLSEKLKYCNQFLVSGTTTVGVSSAQFMNSNTSTSPNGPIYSSNGLADSEDSPDTHVKLRLTFVSGLSDDKTLARSVTISSSDTSFLPETFTCDISTTFNISPDASGVNISHAVNMDPTNANYGMDVTKSTAQMVVSGTSLASGSITIPNNQNRVISSVVNSVSTDLSFRLNRDASGFRCADGSVRYNVSAITRVTVVSAGGNLTAGRESATSSVVSPTLNLVNRCWQEQKLESDGGNSVPGVTAKYGAAVAASASVANPWIAVISNNDSSSVGLTGKVSLFKRINSTDSQGRTVQSWNHCQTLVMSSAVNQKPLGAVSISPDGTRLAISAPLNAGTNNYYTGTNNVGVVEVWNNSSGACTSSGWTQSQVIEAQPGDSLSPNVANSGEQRFGTKLIITADRLIVSAPEAYARLGAVHIYSYNSTNNSYVYFKTLRHYRKRIRSFATSNTAFGSSLSLSGDILAVGAPQNAIGNTSGDGYVQIYNLANLGAEVVSTDAANLDRYLNVPYINSIAEIDPVDSATFFPAPGVATRSGMRFGESVSLSGNRLVVGAIYRRNGNLATSPRAGAAYYYPNYTTAVTVYRIPAQANDDNHGTSVVLTPNGVLVSAPRADSEVGTIFYYNNPTANSPAIAYRLQNWSKHSDLMNFGEAMAIAPNTAGLDGDLWLAVGAPTTPRPSSGSGEAYVYKVRNTRAGGTR